MLPLIQRIISSEKSLLASETYLQAMINNIADGIITIDQQGKIESVNPRLLEIFQYEAPALLGNNIIIALVWITVILLYTVYGFYNLCRFFETPW